MKKIFLTVFAALGLMTLVSCSDSDFNEKYADPSKTTTVSVPQVFTGVLDAGNRWMNLDYWRYYTQSSTSGCFSGVIGNANGRGRFRGASEGYFNIRWQDFYNMLTQYRVLEDTYNNLSDDEKEANKIFLLLGRTIMQAQLHEVLSIWGDAPYSGAGTLWKTGNYDAAKASAKYDDDVQIYKQILTDLKEAGDFFATGNLNAAGVAALARQDFSSAAGSVDIWQRYVNSLRLRIALHLATNGDLAADAKSAIQEILSNPTQYPLIESNDQNIGVNSDTATDHFNYGKGVSQALAGSSMAAGSQAMLDDMNVPANGVPDENTDPRLAAVYDCNPDNEYIAYDNSLTSSEIDEIADEKNKEYVERGITTSNYYCRIDTIAFTGWAAYQGNFNLNGTWINAAEVALSKAEAYLMGYGVAANEAAAKENFIKGVVLSNEYYWNMKTTSSLYKKGNDSYNGFRELTVPTTADFEAYANKIWKATQECVATQLWLNFSFLNELEAWNVNRRTGFPNVKFAKDTQMADYPTPPNRLPYPSDELNFNKDNCEAAKAINYSESTGYYTNLFWAKQTYYSLY